jgi:acetyl esterase
MGARLRSLPATFVLALERWAIRALLAMPDALLRRMVGPVQTNPDGEALDLESQVLLWLKTVVREPPMQAGPLDQARQRMDRLGALLGPRVGRGIRVTEWRVGDRDAKAIRVYARRGARSPSPGLVWFHGGGFSLGSLESHDLVCRALASLGSVAVVAVDYRLAPEHPFPAAVDDAVAVVRWLFDSGEAVGVNPRAVAVGGDSAGANLAAAVCIALRDAAQSPLLQVLAYPVTDFTRSLPSHSFFARGYYLEESAMTWATANYLACHTRASDPRASVLFAPDLSRLPPAIVLTAGFDPLRDEGRRYAERMREAGVVVEHLHVPGAFHGFLSNAGVLRASWRSLAAVAGRVGDRLRSADESARLERSSLEGALQHLSRGAHRELADDSDLVGTEGSRPQALHPGRDAR